MCQSMYGAAKDFVRDEVIRCLEILLRLLGPAWTVESTHPPGEFVNMGLLSNNDKSTNHCFCRNLPGEFIGGGGAWRDPVVTGGTTVLVEWYNVPGRECRSRCRERAQDSTFWSFGVMPEHIPVMCVVSVRRIIIFIRLRAQIVGAAPHRSTAAHSAGNAILIFPTVHFHNLTSPSIGPYSLCTKPCRICVSLSVTPSESRLSSHWLRHWRETRYCVRKRCVCIHSKTTLLQ